MNLTEYKNRASSDENWAPGSEAIDEIFNKLYKDMESTDYGEFIPKRAEKGIEQYLDCYSIYNSPNGYKHIVTHGMSALYADENAFESEVSGFGYEMTIKLKADTDEECAWAIQMLSNFAHYTYKTNTVFEVNQFIVMDNDLFNIEDDLNIAAMLIVNDTEIECIDTIHGRVNFLQLVGITKTELEAIEKDYNEANIILENMKKENQNLVTDTKRTKNFIN